jgi:pectinesterase
MMTKEHEGTKAPVSTKGKTFGSSFVSLRVFVSSCSLLVLFALANAAFSKDLTVAADGTGDFKTVQAAIDAVPRDNNQRIVIHIKPGTYKEHLFVPKGKNAITFRGEDAKTTILTDDKNINFVYPDGKKITTPDSATTLVRGEDFTAENITFENTAGNHGQALAMYHDADRGIFRKCRFLGWQDTLRVNKGRSYFVDCYIEGHVDFIYAHGTAYFDRCHIHCLADGYITAASTPQDVQVGYVFRDCKITAEPTVKRTYLGRPWRPFASVTYINCELPAQIDTKGWDNWGKAENEKTARYAEYNSTGPGARPSERAPWSKQLTKEEADKLTVQSVLCGKDNWDPTHE